LYRFNEDWDTPVIFLPSTKVFFGLKDDIPPFAYKPPQEMYSDSALSKAFGVKSLKILDVFQLCTKCHHKGASVDQMLKLVELFTMFDRFV
jgi:hypothetical protein